jgi:hypothetical protein
LSGIASAAVLCGNLGNKPPLNDPPESGKLFRFLQQLFDGYAGGSQSQFAEPSRETRPEAGERLSAREVIKLPESERIAWVKSTIDLGLPVEPGDALALLVIYHSETIIPILKSRLEEELLSDAPSAALIDSLSELIAYAGDDVASR